jgi:hypothetical protein
VPLETGVTREGVSPPHNPLGLTHVFPPGVSCSPRPPALRAGTHQVKPSGVQRILGVARVHALLGCVYLGVVQLMADAWQRLSRRITLPDPSSLSGS